jgi:hypothetical protein
MAKPMVETVAGLLSLPCLHAKYRFNPLQLDHTNIMRLFQQKIMHDPGFSGSKHLFVSFPVMLLKGNSWL